MSTSVSWPVIGGTTYSIPAAGELNWQALSTFLIAIGNAAQSTANTKLSIRTALTTPVTVASATDTVVITKLTSPAAVLVNLPAGVLGQAFFIVDGTGDASSNNITIDPNGAETINGSATYVINKDRAGVLIGWNGTSWTILAEYTNIAAGTIPRSSIALGSANQVVINDGTGALSSEAQLAKSRGGTGADNSSVTFPSTGVIVTEAGSETLTNKSISGDANTISNLGVTTLKTVIGQATTFLSFDGSGAPIATKVVPTGTVLGTTDAQVITLKDIDGGTATNTSRITVPKDTTTNINALTRKQGTILYDTTTNGMKFDNGSSLVALSAASTATPTVQGLVTSYFPTIASSVKILSSAGYTILDTDGYQEVEVTTAASDRTIVLPAVANNAGRILRIKKVDSGAGFVIVDGNASETIDGALTNTLHVQDSFVTLYCNGTEWKVTSVYDYMQVEVAEYSNISGGTNSAANGFTIAATPGRWRVDGVVTYNKNGATIGAGTSTLFCVTLSSASLSSIRANTQALITMNVTTMPAPTIFVVITTSTTNVYGVVYVEGSTGSPQYAGRMTIMRVG